VQAAAVSPSVNEKTAISLLWIFIVAIVIALVITVTNVPAGVALLASGAVVPIIILSVIFIYYCRKRKAWSFGGGSILGIVGVALRIVVSTQPNLEVGGGLPVGVTVLYIVIGALVSLKCYEAMLELKVKN
jgi:FtsH-binding integral membrane protein